MVTRFAYLEVFGFLVFASPFISSPSPPVDILVDFFCRFGFFTFCNFPVASTWVSSASFFRVLPPFTIGRGTVSFFWVLLSSFFFLLIFRSSRFSFPLPHSNRPPPCSPPPLFFLSHPIFLPVSTHFWLRVFPHAPTAISFCFTCPCWSLFFLFLEAHSPRREYGPGIEGRGYTFFFFQVQDCILRPSSPPPNS